MIVKNLNRETSLVSAKINNQINKDYASNNIVGLRKVSAFQILSSYSSEIVTIQKSPKLIATIIRNSDI